MKTSLARALVALLGCGARTAISGADRLYVDDGTRVRVEVRSLRCMP